MRLPLVIIVGRPNVGKSTLFNRLTGNRNSIVDDVSGVTRDRVYGEVEWNNRNFRIIDTGGYVSDSSDVFEASIREQVEIGLTEADLILFVVDGKTGLSPLDQEIAKMLHASNKTSYLLVNKIDTAEMELNTSEFYGLGFSKIYDIAAISGRNLGDMLDDVLDDLRFPDKDAAGDERIKIAVVGRPNVGKSSLVNSLLGYDRSIVTDIPGTTRDSLDSVLKYYGEELILVDTAGLRKKTKVRENIEFYSNVRTLKAIGDCDVAVVLIDAELGLEKQDMNIIQEAVQRRKGIIIAVNKWDLIEKDNNTAAQYEKVIREKLGSVDYIPVIFISAKSKQRIYKLIDLVRKIEERRKFKPGTTLLNDKLLPEFAQNTPPATPTGKEVKIKYITQVGDHYPIFIVFANQSKHIPDHYKRFIEKTIRRHFDYEGVPFTISLKDS